MRRPSIAGSNNPNWAGDKAGYHAIHIYLSYNYTKPDACEFCHTRDFKRLEWANITGVYTRDRESYKALCTPCHNRLDLKTSCKYGHEFTPDNIIMKNHITKGPWRQCRKCYERLTKYHNNRRKAFVKKGKS
jgi:hypothetical protein